MTQPTPDQTAAGPAYQGRLLPRPDEEVVDQGLAFDLSTVLNRRRMLAVFGLGAGALAVAACGGTSTGSTSSAGAGGTGATSGASAGTGSGLSATGAVASATATTAAAESTGPAGSTASTSASASGSGALVEIPDETAGPYPGDGSNGVDILTASGIVRSDLRTSFGTGSATATGVPFEFSITVLDIAGGGAPFAGVAVYAWHCNQAGEYSLYSSGVESENYLRGVQIADDSGTVTFTSIFPACYSGRWPHVHFEVYPDQASITDAGNAIATSQMALPKSVCDAVYATSGYQQSVANLAQITLASDNVFGNDGGVHQIPVVTGDPVAGYVAKLTAPVDTSTQPSAAAAPGGGPGGPPPGG